MRMLVVEDDNQLRKQIVSYFNTAGWVVEQAKDGSEGEYLGAEFPYDVAIVDVGLPKLSGVEVIRRWRSGGRDFPVLILTARGDWQDKVEGLEAGADDYVTKPFHLEEVLARVNALQRRAGGRAAAVVEYGPLEIDFSSKRVQLKGSYLELTSYEYNTLEYLAHRAGQVVSKIELTEHLYDQDFDRDSNVIEVFVGRLRRKLDPENTLVPIETVRGAGYRFSLKSSS